MKYELVLGRNYRKGVNEGMAEEKRRMAKSFKMQGFPIEAIAKASSLSIEEVKAMD